MRYRASGGIGFVLANYAKRLRAPILTSHDHPHPEMDVGAVRWRLHEFCSASARRPIAKLALRGRNGGFVMFIDRRPVCCAIQSRRDLQV
jgi:hypothetical protein